MNENTGALERAILELRLRENGRAAGYFARHKNDVRMIEQRDIFRAGYMAALEELRAELKSNS